MRGGFGRARETSVRGVYKVALSAWQAEITTAALHSARELVLAAMNFQQSDNPSYDVKEQSSIFVIWSIRFGSDLPQHAL